jgi:hypothetical protein
MSQSMDVKVVDNEKVVRLERDMLKLPQAICSVRHLFAAGLYIRELTMPAGTIALGHAQRHEHMNVMLKGAVRVLDTQGQAIEMRAPLTFVGAPGRKVGYVVEDVVWLNIYPNPDDERDVEKLEARHIVKSPGFVEHAGASDYAAMLEECGVEQALVTAQTERTDDLTDWPAGAYKVKVGRSSIHGQGLIATGELEEGEVICPALFQGKRTPAGRYTNHSGTPNAVPTKGMDGNTYWVALRDIRGCRGGLDGEEITVDYRQTVAMTLRSIA